MITREPMNIPPSNPDYDAHVIGIAALAEPIRRDLYRYVVSQLGPVNRDQAASGVDVARHVAKFHLDRLVEDGVLEVTYARPPGQGGPGAGRPAKYYSRSQRDFAVSLPPRDYELAGRLLAEAVSHAQRDGVPIGDALRNAARNTGRAAGRRARQQIGAHPNRTRVLAVASGVLRDCGYEPRVAGGDVTLANCPFHSLSRDYPDLVCGMNLELMSGLVESLDRADFEARLDPRPGQCCVRLRNPNFSPSRTSRSTKEAT